MLDRKAEERFIGYLDAIKSMSVVLGGGDTLANQFQTALTEFLVSISSDDNMLTAKEMEFINNVTGNDYESGPFRTIMQMKHRFFDTPPLYFESLMSLDFRYGPLSLDDQKVERTHYRSWKALEIFAMIGNRFAAFEAGEKDNLNKMVKRVDYLNAIASILEENIENKLYDIRTPYMPQVPGFILNGSYDECLKVLELMETTGIYGVESGSHMGTSGVFNEETIQHFMDLHTKLLCNTMTDKEKEEYLSYISFGAAPTEDYCTPDDKDGVASNENEGNHQKLKEEWRQLTESVKEDDCYSMAYEYTTEDEYPEFTNENEEEYMENFKKNVAVSKTAIQEEYPYKDMALSELMAELDSLPGLKSVKETVRTTMNLAKMNKLRKSRGLNVLSPTMHMVFTGNPGTGKTTIARLISAIYREMKILPKGQFIETDAEGLIGGYVGQTAIKTKEMVQKARGGILFIDEAYILANNSRGGTNDFGKEAVATLIKLMEDHRDDLVVIFAGYTKEMQDFLDMNPGIRSRINTYIDFPDYSGKELTDIFKLMCKKASYTPSKDCLKYTREYFEKRSTEKITNYANARDVRNFLEKAAANQADRLAKNLDENISNRSIMSLNMQDVENVDLKKQDAPEEKHHRLGFSL